MAESFAVSGIEATEADLSHAGMPPYPTPSLLKLRALARVLAYLSITLRAEDPPFWFQIGGEPCAEGRTGGRSPQGGRGAASPTPGSAIGAAGTAWGFVFGPLWGPDKWVRP